MLRVMKDILALLVAFIMLFATLPYIIDIIKGKTKPNIITWLTWSILIGIGAAALFSDKETNAALLLVGDFCATFAVVIFGLRHGTAKLDRFDIFCQIGAIIGLLLWLIFDSPLMAIIATIVIDLIGTIPTLRHSWNYPEEETPITFLLGVIATVLTLFSLKTYSISAWIYPAYLLISNASLFITINHGKKRPVAIPRGSRLAR